VILSIDRIKERIEPVAKKYGLQSVWVFGSYARNEATENSDVDFLIDRTGSSVKSLWHLAEVSESLSAAAGKPVDVITTYSLNDKLTEEISPGFRGNILSERINIYERR